MGQRAQKTEQKAIAWNCFVPYSQLGGDSKVDYGITF